MAGNQGKSREKTTHNEKKYKNATGQPRLKEKSNRAKSDNACPYAKKCGGCDYQGVEYKEQLKNKQAYMKKLLKPFCFVEPIVGMKNPLYYRHKVHAAFDCTRRGQIVAGVSLPPIRTAPAVRLWREPTGKTHMMWWISKAA